MNMLESMGSSPVTQALGWTLVHSVWQCALIGAAVAVLLVLLRRSSANLRYLVCCGGMALMMVAPPATLILILRSPFEPIAGAAGLEAPPLPSWHLLLPALTLLWLSGVFVSQARLVLLFSHAQHLKHWGLRAAPAALERVARELAEQLNLHKTVRLFESSLARVPTLIGYLRPVILLPTNVLAELTPPQLRAIIAHELAHVRRHDYLVNLIQAVFESLLFYHPAAWWLSNRLRVEREYCCDDVAVAAGGDALGYARALSFLDTLRSREYQPVLASTGGSLMNRIRRLVGLEALPSRSIAGWGGWIAPLLIAAAVIATGTAVSVALPADRERSTRPIDRVDLVSVLEELDADKAEVISTLRTGGLNNRELLMVLDILGSGPDVLEAIERAAKKAHLMERKMHVVRDAVARDLAAGLITQEEAKRHLEYAELEVEVRFETEAAGHEMLIEEHTLIQVELEELQEAIKRDVAEGRLSEKEAAHRLEMAKAGRLARFKKEASDRLFHAARAEFVEAGMRSVRGQIEEDLVLGRITEGEAKKRLGEAREGLNEWWWSQAKRRPDARIVHEADVQMNAVLQEVEEALAAGLISPDEAHVHLADAKRRLEIHHNVFAGSPDDREVRAKLHALHDEIEADLDAGRISKDEAHLRLADAYRKLEVHHGRAGLHVAHEQLAESLAARGVPEDEATRILEHVSREVEQRRARARSDEVRAVLRSLHEQLARSLTDRGVPPQEAKRILEQVQRDLNRRRAKARFGPGHQEAVGTLIAEALMARGISEAEAKKILEDMHRDLTRRMLHGHLEAVREHDPEDAKRPADSQEVEPDGHRH